MYLPTYLFFQRSCFQNAKWNHPTSTRVWNELSTSFDHISKEVQLVTYLDIIHTKFHILSHTYRTTNRMQQEMNYLIGTKLHWFYSSYIILCEINNWRKQKYTQITGNMRLKNWFSEGRTQCSASQFSPEAQYICHGGCIVISNNVLFYSCRYPRNGRSALWPPLR